MAEKIQPGFMEILCYVSRLSKARRKKLSRVLRCTNFFRGFKFRRGGARNT